MSPNISTAPSCERVVKPLPEMLLICAQDFLQRKKQKESFLQCKTGVATSKASQCLCTELTYSLSCHQAEYSDTK
jgi:hypothetical protein